MLRRRRPLLHCCRPLRTARAAHTVLPPFAPTTTREVAFPRLVLRCRGVGSLDSERRSARLALVRCRLGRRRNGATHATRVATRLSAWMKGPDGGGRGMGVRLRVWPPLAPSRLGLAVGVVVEHGLLAPGFQHRCLPAQFARWRPGGLRFGPFALEPIGYQPTHTAVAVT